MNVLKAQPAVAHRFQVAVAPIYASSSCSTQPQGLYLQASSESSPEVMEYHRFHDWNILSRPVSTPLAPLDVVETWVRSNAGI